jgi:mannosyltransferase OCH1-like enzyme
MIESKVIHYCWFGKKPLPPIAVKCIASWKKFLPDYEIKEWNEDNFDVNIVPYTGQAYHAKKYAFVSDYARYWILYHYGGLYFDTDVEIIAPLDDIIQRGNFMGRENDESMFVNNENETDPSLVLGANPGLALYKDMLDMYANISFVNEDGSLNNKTIVRYTSEYIMAKGGVSLKDEIQCVDDIYIYPREYFAPVHYEFAKDKFTENTRSIHHYAASWLDRGLKNKILSLLKKVIRRLFINVKKLHIGNHS